MDGSRREQSSAYRGLGAVASLALPVLLAALGVSIPNVALPTLADAFAAAFPAVQWVVITYLLTMTVVIVGAGRLGDKLGHRRVLLAGIGVFAIGSLLCAAAPTLWMLIGARGVQGLGAAIMMALSMALVRKTVAAGRTGRAMGLLGSMSAIGTASGPALGGLLVSGPGWRAIFLVMVPPAVLALFLAGRYLRCDTAPAWHRLRRADVPGTVLLAATLAAYALAVTLGGSVFGALNGALAIAAVLLAAVFLRIEARTTVPLVDPAMLRDGALRAGLATNALVATVMMATLVVGPFYLSGTLGLDAAAVGLVMAFGPFVSALSGVPAGRIVDRTGAGLAVIAGLTATVAGSLALAALPPMLGVAGYVAALGILTPGYQLFLAANNTEVMDAAPETRRGVTSGMLNLSRNLGLLTGASVMGAVFVAAAGTREIAEAAPDAIAAGMRVTFLVAGGLTGVALMLALALGGRSR
ncbi:MFS transporter [Pelagibacterium xiamenense]|uniref:MFS transporter n=1 Tax=Pelagibacterium xiamenense TaxID=2901140 RepID=UPI001E328DC2|nr:MFS transporter [Pelagibacterium xiamenense]MCD7060246.1 MFS transporter [Pelagibacterium xiamenense]